MPDSRFASDEDRVWRALIRIATVLPRSLDDELQRTVHLSLTEFAGLLHLAEAGDEGLRMSDLAAATGLSPSRITRVVSEMLDRGWAEKSRDEEDARSNVAVITPLGREQFERAYPIQVSQARRLLFDHLPTDERENLAGLLESVVQRLGKPDSMAASPSLAPVTRSESAPTPAY